jgi:hypothetical protein
MKNLPEFNDIEFSKKQDLLKISEISIWLDSYDDIFSDFDPRPYSERLLSDDFLKEAQKVSREKMSGAHELKLLIPRQNRQTREEKIIRKKLKQYFYINYLRTYNEIKSIRIKGLVLIAAAIVILVFATMISLIEKKSMASHILLVLLEPAGWFTIWNGFDSLFFIPGSKKLELEFYKKMIQCNITFISY